MSDLIKIAVDAMGGDGSPKKIIDGIILNNKSNKLKKISIFLSDFGNIEYLLDYFEKFNDDLSKKTLNSFLKSVSNP